MCARVEIGAQYRKFLHHKAQIRIALQQCIHVRKRLFAITAIVVEEFYDRHITIGVAEDGVHRRQEYPLLVFTDDLRRCFFLRGFLLGVERSLNLDHHLGIVDQIISHDTFNFGPVCC